MVMLNNQVVNDGVQLRETGLSTAFLPKNIGVRKSKPLS